MTRLLDSGQGWERDRRHAADLAARRQVLLQHWGEHPANWLWGADLDGRPLIWTKDEGKSVDPVQAFPDKLYLRNLVDVLHTARDPVFIDKPRQMMATWTIALYLDWDCRFNPVRRWLLSKSTEDEAVEILNDKPRFVHSFLPDWVKEALPVKEKPAKRNSYPVTKSYILAVAANAAQRAIRGGTASGILIDEAARQYELEAMVAAAVPMATKIIAVTTAEVGNRGARYFKEIIEEGKKGKGTMGQEDIVERLLAGKESEFPR